MVEHRDSDGVGLQKQRAHLEQIILRAHRLRQHLQPILDAHGELVHFRPDATGVDMVGLTPERPYQGRAAIKNVAAFAARFDDEFRAWCVDVPRAKVTVEKRLQAWLIRESQPAARRMRPVAEAARASGTSAELVFVTDDISVPHRGRRFPCDILAYQVAGGPGGVPAVLEFARARGEGVQRVVTYAGIVDQHAELYARLYGALLGADVAFSGACQRWLFWPALDAQGAADPAEAELAARGVRLVTYREHAGGFRLHVGRPVV